VKYFILIFYFLLSIVFTSNSYSNDEVISKLQSGGKIVFIRHAIAPGNGDPENFNILDCSTQRNLSEEGIKQSKKIGIFFIKNNIKIKKVLSSEWCRCKDTAEYAFKNFQTFKGLNSFYDPRFEENKTKQINDLKSLIQQWDSKGNLILVTHYVVIAEILNKGVSSGEIIITDKNYNDLGSILIR
tara:strand:+ start:1268 stop:1822 length:555 start_codon:yes stop_codon:yes gene_type:complete